MNKDQLREVVNQHLGHSGRLIAASKSSYVPKGDKPVVFNGNVCTEEYGKIWFGDLDITVSEKSLIALASELGVKLFILRESDGRFFNEVNPLLWKAVYTVEPE